MARALLFFCLFCNGAIYGARGARSVSNPPIDCQKMVSSAPADSPWIPQCDENNHLRPFQIKQDGSKFCTDIYVASVLLDQTTVDISCQCLAEATEKRRQSSKPLYVPECDPVSGAYLAKQCNRRGECFCVDSNGRQLGPKWGKTVPLSLLKLSAEEFDHLASDRDRQQRPSCELIAKFWNNPDKRN